MTIRPGRKQESGTPNSVAAHRQYRDRRYEIKLRADRAMHALRDLEDFVRLDLGDDLLADRVRGVHEALSDDVLNGKTTRLSTAWRAKLWDRYCLMRRHNPDAGAPARYRFLRAVRYVR